MNEDTPILLTIWNTPLRVKPAFWGNVLALWGVMSWLAGRRRPQRSWPRRLLLGLLSSLTLISTDVSHAIAHIVSAQLADAPMDEILLSQGMPRTLYADNDVSPRTHRLRALGGPVYSGLSLLTSLIFRRLAPRDSLAGELADWSCLGHGFIFAGSLTPLPFVDGGAILKWTLVERGRTEEEADVIVQEANLAAGAVAATAGVAMAVRRRWLAALGLLAAAAVAIGAALGKFR